MEHAWLYLLLLLGAATGCRRGEMLALEWTDIDFERRRLTVSRSLAQTRAKGVFLKCTKGGERREFSLPLLALEALQAHRTQQAQNRTMFGADYRSNLNLIFATPEGDYLKPDSVTAKVCFIARKLGFPKGISLHTLRHTRGSHLLSHGVPLAAVSERLGHSDPGTTMRIYSHAIKRDDQLSSDTIGSTLLADVGLTGMLGNARIKPVTN
jgi:integrase